MTKTLTEQWRDGTLPVGTYYIVNKNGYEEIDKSVAVGELWNNTDIKEVLAPVPSYEEWQESQSKRALWFEEKAKIRNKLNDKIKLLKEQLDYALETMEQIVKRSDNTVDFVQYEHAIYLINERLKEMEDIK